MLWCKVDKYRTIQVDRKHYSVPETIVASMVQIKLLPLQIKIHDSKGHVVATHERQHAIGQWIIDIDHYWKSLKTKPGALPMSVGMQQADPLIKKVYHQFFSDQNRDFIEIMLFCRQNNVSSQDLEKVMLECQQIFLNSPHTADRVIHLLNRSGQSLFQHRLRRQLLLIWRVSEFPQYTVHHDLESRSCADLYRPVDRRVLLDGFNQIYGELPKRFVFHKFSCALVIGYGHAYFYKHWTM